MDFLSLKIIFQDQKFFKQELIKSTSFQFLFDTFISESDSFPRTLSIQFNEHRFPSHTTSISIAPFSAAIEFKRCGIHLGSSSHACMQESEIGSFSSETFPPKSVHGKLCSGNRSSVTPACIYGVASSVAPVQAPSFHMGGRKMRKIL